MSSPDIVIVGGGVIGLSIAYELASRGIKLTVLDCGLLGRQASWAGAGILAPGSEKPSKQPVAQLRNLSVKLHAEWSERLRDETGIDNGYRVCGGVDVALDSDEDRLLIDSAARWRREGIVFERLVPADLRRVEPALSPSVSSAYFLPDRAQIRNPRHLRALAQAVEKRGGVLRPGTAVADFFVQGDRVLAVTTHSEKIACNGVVVTAGAWSEGLLRRLELSAATPPIRGQIVLLRAEKPLLKRIVEHGSRYLVPRDDGRILIGSTEEFAGFDASTTPEAIASLLSEARRLSPILSDAKLEQAWAGLRPGSIDAWPYLGRAPGFLNLFVAAGHRRAGLQLSTGTAVVMADLILGNQTTIDLSAFAVGRTPSSVDDDAFRS